VVGGIDVLLVEDSPEIRDLVRFSLGLDPTFSVIGEAGDPIEALPMVSEHEPDVVLLDLAMPRMGGLEAIDHVRRASPSSAIVIFSSLLECDQGPRARELGADAYLEKGASIDAMRDTLRAAAEHRAAEHRTGYAAQQRVERILGSASDAIIAWSLDGRITDWNPGAERLYGWTAEEAIGETTDLFTPPQRQNAARTRQGRVMATGIVERFEAVRIRKDGSEVQVAVTASALRNDCGEIVGAMGISRDISAQREQERALEMSERRFRELSESAPVGIAALSADGNITFANAELERIAGYPAARLGGHGWRELIDPDDLARIANEFDWDNDRAAEFRIQRADGAIRTIAVRIRLSHDLNGIVSGRLASVVDVTGERDAVAELTRSRLLIEHQNAELERSNAELEEFAYIASHDLQEPLRVIGGFVDLLRQRYRGQLDGDADKFIDATIAGVERMSQLIDDLLAYSRVGRSDVGLESVDTEMTVLGTLDRLAGPIAEGNVKVKIQNLPVVSGDPMLLEQLFQNLISNAVKFADPDDPAIEVDAVSDKGEWRFLVADNGAGIEERHREEIFEMFKRLHGRSVPGTGIGLAICKRIVDRHGGRIWVEPRAGGGSTFQFTLPG
jgi:PAS domain S-box-containing protein